MRKVRNCFKHSICSPYKQGSFAKYGTANIVNQLYNQFSLTFPSEHRVSIINNCVRKVNYLADTVSTKSTTTRNQNISQSSYGYKF